MDALQQFLTMGGYGGYVWPAYGIGAVVMLALLLASLRGARKAEAELAIMQQLRQDRRRNREAKV
jgi:heme exporter protein D